jgi:hypothetical protein
MSLVSKTLTSIPRWSALRALGANRLFRLAPLWFVLVPLAAKAILFLNEQGESLPPLFRFHQIELPFSWQVFFYSAAFVSLGNVVYSMRCPRIVRNYLDYTQFKTEGRGDTEILSDLRTLVMRTSKAQAGKTQRKRALKALADAELTLEEFRKDYTQTQAWAQGFSVPKKLSSLAIASGKEMGAFWAVRTYADTLNTFSRCIVTLAYAGGILLIVLVISQNVRAVAQLTHLEDFAIWQ